MGKRLLLLLALALPCRADQRPNILLITVDTFRPDHLGYYGYPRPTSPHLDSLSREGVFFRQAFTTSGWTSPGLISILTSLYAPTHGVDIRHRELDPEAITLPEALRQAGYRAPDIFFLTDIPNFANLGFEPYAGRDRYISQGDEILFRWLEEEAHSQQPFFLYYHYRDLHLPYDPKPEYERLFMPPEYGPGFSIAGAFKKFLAREKIDAVKKNVMLVRAAVDFSAADQPWVEALYDAEIRQLDEEFFARLRRVLQARGLDRNTLVVVSADHGEELLDHGLVGHVSTFKEGRLFDELIRIPLILWFPGALPAGRVVEEPVQCIDVMPTLLELIGQPLPPGAQGRSLLPLIRQQPGWREQPIYCETSGGGFTADEEQYQQRVSAVRTARWKLVHYLPADEYTLYDLAGDPQETEDVLDDHSQVADSLRTLLNQWLLYTQRRPYHRAGATAPAIGVSGPPRILFPRHGDTLSYQGEDHSIQLRWTGEPEATYVIEYKVGRGAYHLEGEITEPGISPSYGPFQENFWNSLVLYNPWQFRVYPQDRPGHQSEWVEFHLGPTHPQAERSATLWLWLAWHGLQAGLEQGVLLVAGLGRGLVDLCLWAASIPPADLSAYALLGAIAAAIAWPWAARLGATRCRAWGVALLYIAFVYSTIPLMPQVWRTLVEYTQGAIRYLGIVAVAALGIAFLAKVGRRVRLRRWQPYAALLVIALVYVHLLQRYAAFPAERLHLVEYGLVGYLLLRALRLDLKSRNAYIVSLLLTAVVGAGDEVIQWISPERVFELKDVQLNIVSGGLGLLVARLVLGSGPADQQRGYRA